jgi:hypothetical protein
MSDDEMHECPAPGCAARVPFERFCCPRHWRQISHLTQMRLHRAYRQDFGSESYFEARAACLREIGISEAEIADANAGVS